MAVRVDRALDKNAIAARKSVISLATAQRLPALAQEQAVGMIADPMIITAGSHALSAEDLDIFHAIAERAQSATTALASLGHISRDCTKPQSRSCYTCGSEGHLSRDCPGQAPEVEPVAAEAA
ncbi:hypothetical protein ACEPAI_5184 [Sanghuangporus weigelae]